MEPHLHCRLPVLDECTVVCLRYVCNALKIPFFSSPQVVSVLVSVGESQHWHALLSWQGSTSEAAAPV